LVSGYNTPIEKRPITLQLISNALTSKHNPGPVEMVSWMLTSLPESVFPANRVAMGLKFIDIFYMMVQDRVTGHGKSNKTSLCALGSYFTKY